MTRMISQAKSILLVDDDSDVLELLKDILECEGHRVVMATDGFMGTLKVKNQEFDLIISDLNMPKQNGMKFLTNIIKERKTYGKKIPPVIIISGEITPVAKEICSKGKIPILEKPFSSEQILEEIEKLFEERSKRTSVSTSTSSETSSTTDKNSDIKSIKSSEALFHIGDTLTHLYLVKEGTLTLLNEKDETIGTYEVGSIIGTASAMVAVPSRVKCIALEDSKVSSIPIARITKQLKEQPKWFQAVLIKMAKENLQLQDR